MLSHPHLWLLLRKIFLATQAAILLKCVSLCYSHTVSSLGGNFSSLPPGEFLFILQVVHSSLQHFLTALICMHYPHSSTPHWELPMLFATTGSLFGGEGVAKIWDLLFPPTAWVTISLSFLICTKEKVLQRVLSRKNIEQINVVWNACYRAWHRVDAQTRLGIPPLWLTASCPGHYQPFPGESVQLGCAPTEVASSFLVPCVLHGDWGERGHTPLRSPWSILQPSACPIEKKWGCAERFVNVGIKLVCLFFLECLIKRETPWSHTILLPLEKILNKISFQGKENRRLLVQWFSKFVRDWNHFFQMKCYMGLQAPYTEKALF